MCPKNGQANPATWLPIKLTLLSQLILRSISLSLSTANGILHGHFK